MTSSSAPPETLEIVSVSEAPGRALFGLDEAESALLSELFTESATGLGLDGKRIFAELRSGGTVGQALRLPNGINEVLYTRAHNWFKAGRHDRAETLFRVLCVLDGRDADHWVGYGVCLRMRDNRHEAGIAFATAAAIRPDWAVPHFHAAGLAVAREEWREAQEHLRAFETRIEPTVPDAMRREAQRISAALAQRFDSAGERLRP